MPRQRIDRIKITQSKDGWWTAKVNVMHFGELDACGESRGEALDDLKSALEDIENDLSDVLDEVEELAG